MHNNLISFLRNTFQDRFRRYLIIALVILGVVLIVISQWGAGSNTVMPQEPPIIEGLEVTKDRHGHCYLIQQDAVRYKVGQEQKYDIECIVSDTSFRLDYEWSCQDGEISEISQDGSMITWTAPDTSGDVTVTVTVSDIAGNTVTESIILNVVSCSPCTFREC